MSRGGSGLVLAAACLAAVGLGAARPAAPAALAATPTRALTDDLAFTDSRPEQRALAFATARRAGARVVRLTLDWSLVAPGGQVKPEGFHAADPGDPAYRWGYVEDAVRDAARHRLRILLVVRRAPAWAEGPGRPADAPAGAWRPDPAELGAFVRAAARRFSGFYPDPKDSGNGLTGPGRSLPHVRFWQIWDEPNGGATLLPIAGVADRYRRLLGRAFHAVRRVSSDNMVVSAGTADRGPISARAFWRALLCPTGSRCSGKARFDVAAHNLDSRRAPGRSVSQVRTLRRLLGRRPLWLTEVGWDTPPQDPRGVDLARQARYLSTSLFLADRAGVELVAWRGLQDRTSYLEAFPSIASGLFFNSENDLARDAPKPAYSAYRFPFAVRGTTAWGIAPRPRRLVRIELRRPGGWRGVATVRPGPSGEFTSKVGGGGEYRARQTGVRSPTWTR